jgi:membrane protein YqaA with SNARE-associated domain
MNSERRLTLFRILAVLAVIAISVAIWMLGDQIRALASYGYLGIFFFSILANATIILPAPGIAIVFAMGGVLNPLLVAFAAAAGSAIGELSGYLVGFGGQAVVEDTKIYAKISSFMTGKPSLAYLAIFTLAAIPNPFFDIAGIAAGTLRIPILPFLFFCFLGKTVKMIAIAYAGYFSLDFFTN